MLRKTLGLRFFPTGGLDGWSTHRRTKDKVRQEQTPPVKVKVTLER